MLDLQYRKIDDWSGGGSVQEGSYTLYKGYWYRRTKGTGRHFFNTPQLPQEVPMEIKAMALLVT